MRFLADENFPGEAVAALRAAGHDVSWIGESSSGASDKHVLALAENENRILLTFARTLANSLGAPACRRRAGSCCFVFQRCLQYRSARP
jgi:predicted nuclease of predicted toxin-antitoxin system